MKIFLGPAGIPTVSKGGGTPEGIRKVSELDLNAMEVEFVRGVKMGSGIAKECGKVAEELNIKLSVHAPYFINLSSADKKVVEASKKRIFDSALRAGEMGAWVVVFHPGYYSGLPPERVFEAVKQACEDLIDRMKSQGIKDVLLGLETTGKVSQFGTLEENIEISKKVEGCVPVLDPAHLFARNGGKIDYAEIFEKIKVLNLEQVHMHFSSVKWRPVKATGKGNEWYHMEIKNNQPPFEPLAKEVLKRKLDITIISESPILEQDSFKMKEVFERLGYKFD
jgi:deoxyribonuclease-4